MEQKLIQVSEKEYEWLKLRSYMLDQLVPDEDPMQMLEDDAVILLYKELYEEL